MHFRCIVRIYDLNCVENANQLSSTQGEIHEYSFEMGRVSVLTNQIAYLEKSICFLGAQKNHLIEYPQHILLGLRNKIIKFLITDSYLHELIIENV